MVPHSIQRTFAIGVFRSSVFFFCAIAAFSESDARTRTILITMVFLIDVATWYLANVATILSESVYTRSWSNTLADRFFIDHTLENVRDGIALDPESLRLISSKEAVSDVEKFLSDTTVWFHWGWFKKTLHGIGYFLWFWISYGVFYAIAGALGSMARTGY